MAVAGEGIRRGATLAQISNSDSKSSAIERKSKAKSKPKLKVTDRDIYKDSIPRLVEGLEAGVCWQRVR